MIAQALVGVRRGTATRNCQSLVVAWSIWFVQSTSCAGLMDDALRAQLLESLGTLLDQASSAEERRAAGEWLTQFTDSQEQWQVSGVFSI